MRLSLGFFHLLLHLLERHHRVLLLAMVDGSDGFLVEVDDLRAVRIDTGHAVALNQHGRSDGVHCVLGAFAEGSGKSHHRDHGPASNLGSFVVAEVSERWGGT